jgi:hypothetical protein
MDMLPLRWSNKIIQEASIRTTEAWRRSGTEAYHRDLVDAGIVHRIVDIIKRSTN